MKKTKVVYALTCLFLLAANAGCKVGYTRMLFATKSYAAMEVDTAPPTIQVGLGRLEGVYAPQFEDGKKLPVLASFRFDNDSLFAPYIGSAFATGDAAMALAALYDEETPKPGPGKTRIDLIDTYDSSLVLSKMPDVDHGDQKDFEKTRPIFFATDTSFGIKVAWSGLTAQYPDAARLGFARKEVAWAPITCEQTPNPRVRVASLLATIDTGSGAVSNPALKLQYIQYFASGKAATLLAMQRDVRTAMLYRLDPNTPKVKLLNQANALSAAYANVGDDVAKKARAREILNKTWPLSKEDREALEAMTGLTGQFELPGGEDLFRSLQRQFGVTP